MSALPSKLIHCYVAFISLVSLAILVKTARPLEHQMNSDQSRFELIKLNSSSPETSKRSLTSSYFKSKRFVINNSLYRKVLRLKWIIFRLSSGEMSNCIDSSVEITVGCNEISKRRVGRFCGEVIPHDIFSFEGCIEVEWHWRMISMSDFFMAVVEIIDRSSNILQSTPYQMNPMTASSGIIVLNSRNNTRRIVRFQNSIETKKSNFAIQLNRIDAVGFSIYSSTESIAPNPKKVNIRLEWTVPQPPPIDIVVFGWFFYPCSPYAPQTKTEEFKFPIAAIVGITAFALFLLIVCGLLYRRAFNRKRTTPRGCGTTPDNNPNTTDETTLNYYDINNIDTRFHNLDYDVDDVTDQARISRDTVLTSMAPPKYCDVIAEGPIEPPPTYNEACSQ